MNERKKSSILKMNFTVLKFVFKFCPMLVVFALLNVGASVVTSLSEINIIAKAIKLVIAGEDFKVLYENLISYIIIIACCYVFKTFYSKYISQRYRIIYTKKMQSFLFNKVKRIDMASYDDPEFYDKFSRGLNDSTWRGIGVFNTFIDFIQSIAVTFALGTYVVFTTDIYLLAIILFCAFINILVINYTNKVWYKTWRDAEPYHRYTWYVKRTFYQQKFAAEIKTTSIGNLLIDKFDDNTYKIQDIYVKSQHKAIGPNVIYSFCHYLIEQAGSYLYLAIKLIKGIIDVSSFTATINAITKLSSNIVTVVNVYTHLREHSYYISDFLWIVNYEPKVETNKGLDAPSEFKELDIKNVIFSYPKTDFNSIDNISMKITNGEKIAIVGDNGGGKSTLMKLLLKFYNPTSGSITLNGIDLKEYNEESVRKLYSIVYQDFQIYACTIAENVLMRRIKSKEDEDKVKDALKMVGLLDKVLKMKDGIYTQVTREFDRDGASFSGGERQRLVISRVFASDSSIYILDEPTAALDPLSEERINKLIIQNVTNKTMIIIAHRLSTVVDADIIYLIKDGKIYESGTHEELMNKGGRYFEMFSTQKSLYEKD